MTKPIKAVADLRADSNRVSLSTMTETGYYRLEKFIKWEHIGEANEMLIQGCSPRQVSQWCKDHGFSISHPKLYEYKELLQESIAREITIERLLGIGVPKRKSILLEALDQNGVTHYVKNEMELLDHLIHAGMSALNRAPEIKIETAMKAIELKNKLTGGKHAGLTMYGLDQLRELERAKMDAIIEVVMSYLPEDKHEELAQAVALAERAFYETQAPELLAEYEQALKDQEEAGRTVNDMMPNIPNPVGPSTTVPIPEGLQRFLEE